MTKKVYGEASALAPIAAQWQSFDSDNYSFRLHPELWRNDTISAYFQSKKWTSVEFVEANRIVLPTDSGVYMFVAEPHLASIQDHSYIFYVGKATNLRTRYGEYLKEKKCKLAHNRKSVVKFLNHLECYLYFHYTLIPSSELDKAEGYLKDNIDPPANTQTDIIGRLEGVA